LFQTVVTVIVAYTDYDKTTNVLAKLAASLINQAGTRVVAALGPMHATAGNLHSILLQEKECALFFFGHGTRSPLALVGQDQEPVIDCKSDYLLENRIVYATSCHSTVVLASSVASRGVTVMGYHGELRVPLMPRYEPDMLRCALSGAFALLAGSSTGKAIEEMRANFKGVADKLIGGGILDQAMAVEVFGRNSRALTLLGDDQRTLRFDGNISY
jgi:hypothetical protein